jgi:ABC-type antimicrobial peptide transport system permease subunit
MILKTIGFILFFSLGYAAAFLMLWIGFREARQGIRARSWPTTLARLETCEIRRRSGKGVTYYAAVKYSYEIGGVPYTGENVKISYWSSSNIKTHEAMRERITTMAPFMIRYDPAKPEISTIFLAAFPFLSWTLFLGVFSLTVVTVVMSGVLHISGAGRTILAWFAG